MDNELGQRLKQALREIERLKQENVSLKLELSKYCVNGLADTVANHSNVEDSRSTPGEKIALFRSLFRGREDVYPVRWTSKTGKSGYSPSCLNEWSTVCKKPQIKCSECSHRAFEAVTDEVIGRHLNAAINRTVGIYPMLEDETCWLLAIDLDKQGWMQDAAAVMDTCRRYHIPASLERSRSGNGGHIWVFFEQSVDASIARKLGSAIITRTREQRYQLPLESYDRLFPNQDTMPKGGFGNLIALPLQGIPRREGNSVFVDESFQPYEDQWSYLSGVDKLSYSRVHQLVYELTQGQSPLGTDAWEVADTEGQHSLAFEEERKPVIGGPLPTIINVVLANMIYIEKRDLSAAFINRLQSLATFKNPEFYKAQAMRLSTYGKPRVIGCYDESDSYIAIPRGCFEMMMNVMHGHQINVSITDERNMGSAVKVAFSGTLSMLQDGAARAMLAHDTGILSATTAFGKTVVAASVIAARKVSTLVLVHRRELMEQWKERLGTFLDLDPKSIGIIGGGKDRRTGIVDIAVIQSLNHKGVVKDCVEEYGQLVVDECHHVSAFSFEQVLKKAKAKYVLGLTATPTRQDGHQPIVQMQCGPIRIKIDAKSQAQTRGMEHKVIPRYTNFRLPGEMGTPGIQAVYQLLVEDEERNNMIFDDLLTALDQGRSPILLTERTAHVEYFENRLKNFAKNVIVLRGGMGKKQRQAIREQIAGISDTEERVFIATGKLIGEGFDDARLDTLFLVHPISWKGTLQQYAGRLHRSHQGKREVQIYDYVDLQVPVLAAMYKKRVKGYQAMGYRGMSL